MSKAVLTDAAVRRFKGGSKRCEIADGGGLYLIVQSSGSKSFALRFRDASGKSAKMTLGGFDETVRPPVEKPKLGAHLTLVEARLLAAKIDHQRAGGTDVVAERKADKFAARRKAADDADNAYPSLLRRYVEEHLKPHTKRWRDGARLLGLAYPKDGGEPTVLPSGLADRWATKTVGAITPDAVFLAVDEAVRKGAPGLGRRRKAHERAEPLGRSLHSTMGAFFSWCMRQRLVTANPCATVHKPRASAPRERVLSDEEVVKVWRGCDQLAAPYAAMVRLLTLTGGRVREIAGMRWSEFSADLTMWTLPKARAKNRREHRVPLSKLARDIIMAVPRIEGSDFVLTFTGERGVDGHASVKRALDQASGVRGWVFHDIRRTLATSLQRLGVRLEVTEAVLNHTGSRSGIVGIYQKYGFDAEKAQALSAWADHVTALIEGREAAASNVVELAGRRA